MYSTSTNGAGQFRDSCGSGEEKFPERNVGQLSVSFPGAPTVTVTVVSKVDVLLNFSHIFCELS